MQNNNFLTMNRAFSYLLSTFINPSKAIIAPMKKIDVSLLEMGEEPSSTLYNAETNVYSIRINSNPLQQSLSEVNRTADAFQMSMLYILAMYYHQMAHIGFSSFNSRRSEKLLEVVKNENEKEYALGLFHILEDLFIEAQLIYVYSRSRYYLSVMNEGIANARISVYKDEISFNSVYNYLAIFLRQGNSTQVKNTFIDKNKSECFIYISDFYSELDSEKRFDISLDFYQYLKKNLPEPQNSDKRKGDNISSLGEKGLPFKMNGGKGQPGKEEDGSKMAKGKMQPGEDEIDGDPDDVFGEGNGDYFKYFKDKSALPSYDKYSDQIIDSTCTHEFVDINNAFEVIDQGKMERFTDKLISRNSDLINEVMQIIDEFRTANFVYQTPGFNSGHFSMSTYVKDEPLLKCFTRPSGFSFEKDLAFYLLVDNSGSMADSKAKISTEAMMVLYECLARLEIPFEYSMFTSSHDGNYADTWTYVIKDINTDPSLGYKYLPISYSMDTANEDFKAISPKYHTFAGNQEDNNIFYIHKRMQEWAKRNKILIVLCDGGTCGQGGYARLRKTVAEATDEGILVLGIGIMEDVSHLYKNYKNFKSYDDLKRNFAPFLADFLIKNITE